MDPSLKFFVAVADNVLFISGDENVLVLLNGELKLKLSCSIRDSPRNTDTKVTAYKIENNIFNRDQICPDELNRIIKKESSKIFF